MLLRAAAARITSSVLASCSYTTAAGGGGRSLEVARAAAVWWTARRIGGQPTVTPAPAARSPAWPPTPRLWAGLSTSTVRQAPPDDPPAPTPGLNPLLRTPGPPPPAPGAAPPPPTSAAAGGKDDVSIQTTPPTPGPARNSARAVLRGVRISPKKLARFARILPRLGVEDAAAQCAASPTKAAALCAGVLASAAANAAANHGLGGVPLRVLSAVVGRAATPKRAWFHGKGRAGVRRSYRAHLAIEVERAAGRGRGPPLAYVRPISERKLEAARRRWVGVV